MTNKRYSIPKKIHRCETEVERSRFIATVNHASSPEEAAQFITQIKAEFPAANHNCWAYLIGPPGSSDKIGLSDDGEPHGAAGKPILTVLQHSDLGDVVIVVTRYFGGIKLGKGGMVKAYTLAAKNVLEQLPLTDKVDWTSLSLTFEYCFQQQLERMLPEYEAEMLEKTFSENVCLTLRCPRELFDDLTKAVTDLCQGQIKISENKIET